MLPTPKRFRRPAVLPTPPSNAVPTHHYRGILRLL
nr:MAG TPA: hypothetical protein [Caudoviricetes sp.]